MQTNNVFTIGRLGLYMRKQLVDNYRLYGMSVIVLTVLLIIFSLSALSDNMLKGPSLAALIQIFFIGMFLTGLIFTSLSFSELGSTPRGIDFLLFPASQLEKFLSTLLITTLGFMLIYHFACYLAYLAIDGLLVLSRGIHMKNDLAEHLKGFPWQYFYLGWFIAQAMMLLGAIYFQKYSFIKTIFLVMVFVAGLYFLNTLFVNLFFGSRMPKWNAHFPFIGVNVMLGATPSEYVPQTHKFLMLPTAWIDGLLFFLKYLVTPILWALAYMRLIDKEM